MGERVEFASIGHTCQAYMAVPPSGKGPALVVIQEWWGVNPHIESIVDRFAAEGFLTIAPDLFHGKTTKSPDEAGKWLMELDSERAAGEIAGAGNYLFGRPECASEHYGVVGFCMGGALAQLAATRDKGVGAAVSFYGGFKKLTLDWSQLAGPILLIYGANDHGVPAEGGATLKSELDALGKDVTVTIYPNAGHAFFNDTRPEAYNAEAADAAWAQTLAFFRSNLN